MWRSFASAPSPRHVGSGLLGIPSEGRRRPSCPLSKPRPKSVAGLPRNGKRHGPRESHIYRERVTISVTSASLSSIGFPRILLAFCAAVTTAGISSSLSW